MNINNKVPYVGLIFVSVVGLLLGALLPSTSSGKKFKDFVFHWPRLLIIAAVALLFGLGPLLAGSMTGVYAMFFVCFGAWSFAAISNAAITYRNKVKDIGMVLIIIGALIPGSVMLVPTLGSRNLPYE